MPDDDKLNALALDLMQRSRIIELRNDADEVAALIAAREKPIPQLPIDDAKRASMLLVMLLASRDRERRWQKLCFPGSEV